MSPYDEWCIFYDRLIRRKIPVIELSFDLSLSLLGDLAGKSVCDLGCGQGELARRMARLGARVTAVDTSERMLDLARSYPSPPHLRYLRDDARKPSLLPPAAFDAVVANLMLMDTDEFEAVFRTAHAILAPGGRMVWTVTHPCFESPYSEPLDDGQGRLSHRRVSRYAPQWWQSRRPNTLRAALGAWHRPLSVYVNAFLQAGFRLVRMEEPVVAREVALEPDQLSHYELPPLLGVSGVKPG